jgi:tetratricopeptide (TPR) repeat protein
MSPDKDEPVSAGLEPIHTSTVLSSQPTLSWPLVAGAIGYDVTVSYADGLRIWTATTTETTLECAGDRRLRGGYQYVWEVTAKLADQGSRRAYRGEFTVGTDQQRNEVSQIEELIAESTIEYLVLAASWYERNGLLAEAIAVSHRVAKLEPKSAAAQEALARLYNRAGRREDAKKAQEQADAILSQRQGPPRVRSIFDD